MLFCTMPIFSVSLCLPSFAMFVLLRFEKAWFYYERCNQECNHCESADEMHVFIALHCFWPCQHYYKHPCVI